WKETAKISQVRTGRGGAAPTYGRWILSISAICFSNPRVQRTAPHLIQPCVWDDGGR
ncbi:hypothetical protein AMECASPLE_007157, partial [Ameca splendens]